MKRVIGIGGFFFRAKDPKALAGWYKRHLGLPIEESFNGYIFDWKNKKTVPSKGYTIWSPFESETKYIEPSEKAYMFNFIVDDLVALLEMLKSEGIEQLGDVQDTDFGKFAWILDPEDHKVELWEPAEL